jgi:hypothetical protein
MTAPTTELAIVSQAVVPAELIEGKILSLRGRKVLLDRDLAELYGVTTKRLNEQVRRNLSRFPEDFMFQLTADEWNLRSHFATSSTRAHGGRRYLPLAFTEQGVAMLSSVLTSERAILVNIAIMRTFVRMRDMLISFSDLAERIEDLRRKDLEHDENFEAVFTALNQLAQAEGPRRQIGYPLPIDS